jgi:hypothetical protein
MKILVFSAFTFNFHFLEYSPKTPILLYGSEIWGYSKNIDCLKKIQLRFCKLLLKLKSSAPTYMIYGELGRFPIEIDIQIRMVSL